MVGLVCIDVDGTLVGSAGTVAPEVWEAAARARAAGIHLALCSGRPAFGAARAYAERLDRDGWHVFQNGASVLQPSSGASRSQPLPAPAVERLVESARRSGRPLELYTDFDYAVESTAERARQHAGLLGVPFRTRDLRSLREPVVRAQWLLSAEQAERLPPEDEGLTVALSHSPVMPGTTFVSVTAAGIDKGHAVRALAEQYGIALARVMMVGDGLNDVTALHAVGVPVAMGNAVPEVRAAALHQVADVDGGGVVEALALALRL